MVDTEGLWEHAKLARAASLPHAAYFDKLKEEGGMLSSDFVAKFLAFLLEKTENEQKSLMTRLSILFANIRYS